MQFGILGPLELRRDDGEAVRVRSGKLAALLAVLLVRRNQLLASDLLIEELWEGAPPSTAAKTLQVYVSQLRKVLPADRLLTQSAGYVLRVEIGEVDADRFEQQLATGRRAFEEGKLDLAAESFESALAVWRGPVLAESRYAAFAQAEIRRLEELRLEAQEERLAVELARGHHRDVVGQAEALVREQPLRESLRAQLMLALYRSGRQADALAAYRQARRQLSDELGIEPGQELRTLEQEILRQDEAIAAPVRARAVPSGRRFATRPRVVAAAAAAVTAVVVATLTLVAGGHKLGAVADGVVRIDARSGRVTRQVELGTGPGQTAAGAGAIWTSNTLDDTVSRIDPGTGQAETIPVGLRPSGLAVDTNAVWVANGEANTLARVDPVAAKVVQPVAVGNAPAGVAIGAGSVWVANTADGTVTRVAEGSGKVLTTIRVGPGPLAVAADRAAVWVTLSGAAAVARIAPRTNQVVDEVNVGNDPSALALGRRSVWVASTDDGTVSRIVTATDRVSATQPVGPRPVALAEAAGFLWVALGGGSLAQLDPTSLRVEKRVRLGSAPTGLAALGNAVWMTALPPVAMHRGGTLRVDVASLHPCRCMDPAVAVDPQVSWNFLALVYDGLVAYPRVGGPAGNELVGDLAESVPRSTDGGRTYVFRLRRGVRFSTGAPVRPTDVRHSFERVLRLLERIDPGSLPPWRDFILGADRCTAARCDLSAGIETDDATGTVTFRLRSPEPDFLDQLALPYAYVLPATTPFRVVARPPGATGEYEIASLRARPAGPDEAKGTMVLLRNPAFRGYSPAAHPGGFPDRIAVRTVANPTRAVANVERGRADIAFAYGLVLSESTLERLAVSHAAQLHADSLGSTQYMFLNTRLPPFDNVLARRALNYAVDRGRLVELLREVSSDQPTCQLLPPGLPGYRPYCPYTRDPTPAEQWSAPNLDRARALVAASGTRGTRVQVWTKSNHAIPGIFFTALLRSLGYRATTRIVPEAEDYYGMVTRSGKVQIGWTGWARDYSSAADFFLPTVSCSALTTTNYWAGANWSRFCDPAIDRLIHRALNFQSNDPERADAAWAAVDRAVAAAAPIVPYANEISETLVSRRIGNYQYSPQWGPLLDQLWVR
jgi:ABC-type transport system substrate-binding protein/DNA-binding SARP family transcriptional activator